LWAVFALPSREDIAAKDAHGEAGGAREEGLVQPVRDIYVSVASSATKGEVTPEEAEGAESRARAIGGMCDMYAASLLCMLY
jgi:hypothetical protein